MAAYSVSEATTGFSALLEKAQNGEEVLIADPGKPVVRMVPVEAEAAAPVKKYYRPGPGFAKGQLTELIKVLDEPLDEEVQRAFGMID